MLSFSLRLLRPWEPRWGHYLWLQITVDLLPQTDASEKCLEETPWQRCAYLPQNTLAPLGWKNMTVFSSRQPLGRKKKKDYMVKCQNPSRCQRDWQQFLVLLEYVSSWESINVLQASRGRMKASPSSIVYASCQAWGREGGPGGKGICHHVLEEEWLKNLGMLGWRKRIGWELQYWIFGNSRAVMWKREQIWSW